ncbi:MAG: hypothetical protein J6A52_00325 [Bacilli bacterium]|nr:hypothetical protein [Bacilli bacterium]
MDKKITITDFLDILYTTALQQPFFELLLSDIYTMIRIVDESYEFRDLRSMIEPCDLSQVNLFKGQRIAGKRIIPNISEERRKEIEEKYQHIIDRCNDLMYANHLIELTGEETNELASIELDSPDGIYTLGHSDMGYSSSEIIVYTDGEIENVEPDDSPIDRNYSSIRNIKISNSTYTILKMMRDNEPTYISAKSKILSNHHILGEIKNVISGRTSHYKLLDRENPKVYILRRQ